MNGNLSELVKNATGIADDSRTVKPGFIFIAVKGKTVDGHDYIENAVKNGAKTVIGERPPALFARSGFHYIQVADSRQTLGEIASEWFGNPSEKLKVIGVTGTKGKTTTAHLVYHILTKLGKKTGLISSIMAKIGDKEMDTGFHVTSPDVISLHRFLKEMINAGCEYAVIEVSSHGIDQKRIAGVKFEVGALTNIAPEHLDYHKTFDEYTRVKMEFINSAKRKVMSPIKTNLKILPGEFNNINAQAAVEVVTLLGIDKKGALEALKSFKLPIGRMEEIKNGTHARIFIDFAHTPDSLEKALTYLKSITKGKLISVFGCAGERDPGKRTKMGKISSQIADLSVFTAEDPRSEDIFDILAQMEKEASKFISIPERGEALAYALSRAGKGDVIGIFGKGHEQSLAYKGFEHPWSDQAEVKNWLGRKTDISAIILAAGMATRMKSDVPKVLHEICGRPMIAYTLQNLRRAGIAEIIAVIAFEKEKVMKRISGEVKFAVQKTAKGGTADAAKSGLPMVSANCKTLIVINGDDSAFYTPETIRKIIEIHSERERKLTFVSLMKDDPMGLGRVIRGANGLIVKIVEEKDATDAERKIKEVNDGLYVFDREWFNDNIGKVKKGSQGEYYLVDLVKLAIDEGARMATYTLPNDDEWQGVNTPEQLTEAEKKMEARLK